LPGLRCEICTGLTIQHLRQEGWSNAKTNPAGAYFAGSVSETGLPSGRSWAAHARQLKPGRDAKLSKIAHCCNFSCRPRIAPALPMSTAVELLLARQRCRTEDNQKNNFMPLLYIVGVLIVVGVLLWLVNNYIPMDGKIKGILNAVVVIAVVIYLLQVFGLLGTLENIKVGHISGT